MTEALAALGGLPGVAALVTSLATLAGILKVKKDTAQLTPNHGSSLADAVKRIEDTQRSHGHQLGEIKADLLDERRDRRASDEDLRDRVSRLEGR